MGANSVNVVGATPLNYSKVSSAAYESGHIIKAGPGKLIMLKGYNSGPDQFIQIHDAVAAPADGVAPWALLKAWAADNFYFLIPVCGTTQLATGIYVCNSTTGPTKTIGAADCWFEAFII